jgi:hypothetical protein
MGNIIQPIAPALAIHDGNQVTVLKIEADGKMFWRPQGSTELEELDIDKDLTTAFTLCVEMLSGMGPKQLLEDVRSKAVKAKADVIAEQVAQYLIDIKHIKPEDKSVHIKNVTTIVNGI